MKKVIYNVTNFTAYLLSFFVFPRLLRVFIHVINLSLGLGYGAISKKSEVGAARKLLAQKVKEGSQVVVFDVGANVGDYTEQILKQIPNARVYAFEPSSAAFKILAARFKNDPRVIPQNYALSDTEQKVTLWSDSPGSGLGSLTRRRLDHYKIDFAVSEVIDARTCDSVCKKFNVTPDLIKIDVEGNELKVLRGASEVIKESPVIQFEFGGCNIDTRTYFQDFFYFFSDLGFKIFRIKPSGIVRIKNYNESLEFFQTTNYIVKRQ